MVPISMNFPLRKEGIPFISLPNTIVAKFLRNMLIPIVHIREIYLGASRNLW